MNDYFIIHNDKKMNAQDIIDMYGDTSLKFTYYHKYMFNYCGVTRDRYALSVSVGKDANKIYNHCVIANELVTLNDLSQLFEIDILDIDISGERL